MNDPHPNAGWTDDEVRLAVEANGHWYHTMELRPGIVTPGWFDLRPIVDRLPWPDLRGKRCLDIGTYDGYLAFEMERRGAAEVVATDIADHSGWDWPLDWSERGPGFLRERGGRHGYGYEVASRALGSAVKKVSFSVHQLDPLEIDTFDFVLCGSLLIHLRDPLGALERIRSVCRGQFMSCEMIDVPLTVTHRRKPTFRFVGAGEGRQWFIPNVAAHRRMIRSAGFRIERTTRPYSIPMNEPNPWASGWRALRWRSIPIRVVTGSYGSPHSAVLAHPIGDQDYQSLSG